jgi:Domain of unknown function (DUF4129)
VLKRPEFKPDRTQARILEWIDNLLGWLGSLRQTSPGLWLVLVVGCCVVLGLVLAHLARVIRRTVSAGRRLHRDETSPEERTRLSQLHREEALRRAADGEFTEAVRFLFLSLVYRFDESGRVSFQKAYTNREYLELFAERPEVREELRVFVETLDENWYGQHPTDRARYESCLARYESLASGAA